MPKLRAYIETTIPSFYHEPRTGPELVAWRNWTREWWMDAKQRYELITSSTVLRELAAGARPQLVRLRMDLLRGIPLVFVRPPVAEIARTYIRHKLMPAKPEADATHLALASVHTCDLIVTWDRRHLANPNKAAHIRRINTALGLHVPELVTPRDLLRRGE